VFRLPPVSATAHRLSKLVSLMAYGSTRFCQKSSPSCKKYPFWLAAANSLLSANIEKSRFAIKIALTKRVFCN
jgi:hypothetical protein